MGKRPQPRLRMDALTGEWRNGEAGEGWGSEPCEPRGTPPPGRRCVLEVPPLGPGGEDITWPDQVAPRGRKASSTRKIKPQTSNLIGRTRSTSTQNMTFCLKGTRLLVLVHQKFVFQLWTIHQDGLGKDNTNLP